MINYFLILLILISLISFDQKVNLQLSESSPYIIEYEIPTKNAGVAGLTTDNEGNVWFVEVNASKLGVFFVSNETFKEFEFEIEKTNPPTIALVALSQIEYDEIRNKIYFTWSYSDAIIEFDLVSKTFKYYFLPTKRSGVFDILIYNGTIWFTELFGNKIGKLIPEKNEIIEYDHPSLYVGPAILTKDSKGFIWYTLAYGSRIAYFDPKTIKSKDDIKEIIPSKYFLRSPVGIDAFNDTIWVADHGSSSFLNYIPFNNTWKLYLAYDKNKTLNSLINDLKIDSKGNVWFTSHLGNTIGKFDRKTGVITEYEIPTKSSINLWLTIDKNDTVWFSEWSGNKIAKVIEKPNQEIEIKIIDISKSSIRAGIEDVIEIKFEIYSNGKVELKIDSSISDINNFNVRIESDKGNIFEIDSYSIVNLKVFIKSSSSVIEGYNLILGINFVTKDYIKTILFQILILNPPLSLFNVILVIIFGLLILFILLLIIRKIIFKKKKS